MSNFLKTLHEAIEAVAVRNASVHELNVDDAINHFSASCPDEVRSREFLWEGMAFRFAENDFTSETHDCIFGPLFTAKRGSEELFDPDPALISDETIAYWTNRATEASHPFLTARYALLAWNYSSKPDPQMARLAIRSILRFADDAIIDELTHSYTTSRLAIAIHVSLRINDLELLSEVIAKVVEFDTRASEELGKGTWPYSYDILIGNKSVLRKLNQSTIQRVIEGLESILLDCSGTPNTPGFDPFACEDAALRLAGYYRRMDRFKDLSRVMRRYRRVVEDFAKTTNAMQGSACLQKLHQELLDFGLSADAKEVLRLAHGVGRNSLNELGTISTTIETPVDDLREHAEQLTSGTHEESLIEIARSYIPTRSEALSHFRAMAEKAPLMAMIPLAPIDATGRTVARIGTPDDDLEGKLTWMLDNMMTFDHRWLSSTVQASVPIFETWTSF